MDAVRLELPSDRDMVDLAEIVSGHIARIHQMADDDVADYGLAVRESVTNAIVHGNQEIRTRRVSIEFNLMSDAAQRTLVRSRVAVSTTAWPKHATRTRSP